MGKRPTIPDLAAAAGVSIATVDRVLNGRHPVRPGTAERVYRAAEAIGFHATTLLKQRVSGSRPTLRLGFLMQKRNDFYQALAADLVAAADARTDVKAKAVVEFVGELTPAALVEALRSLGGRVDAIAAVSIDHPHVGEEIERLRAAGVPVVAALTDLTTPARAGYVGRDDRKEGRTAAFLIARMAREPGRVGIIVGTHRYLCQETAEISFRGWFREQAPEFRLAETLVNLDDPRIAYEATVNLLGRSADLVGLYICGGGQEGMIRALREEAPPGRIIVVCHELTPVTRAALIDGVLTGVISTATDRLAERTVEQMVQAATEGAEAGAPRQSIVPFELYLPENV